MASTDKGAVAVTALFAGAGTVAAFNQTNTRIGVGDSSAPFAVTQTDLQAVTNKLRKLVNSAPVITANLVEYTTIFANTEANYAWNELALFNSPSGDYMATRRLISLGTKPGTEEWEITAGVVFSPMS